MTEFNWHILSIFISGVLLGIYLGTVITDKLYQKHAEEIKSYYRFIEKETVSLITNLKKELEQEKQLNKITQTRTK